MKISCKKLILYPLSSIVFSTFLLSGNAAKADVAVAPLVIETAAKQGQAQGTITVTNGDAKSFRARVYTQPFTYDLQTGFDEKKTVHFRLPVVSLRSEIIIFQSKISYFYQFEVTSIQ